MYDFRTLSPLDFEDLVRDLLQAELQLRFESFAVGRDTGIDFRFASEGGGAIVQAKHFVQSGPSALVTAMKKEDAKVASLAPSRYLLATSVPITPELKKRIRKALPNAPLIDEDIFGQDDLNNLLGRHPAIERKHFKLWLSSTNVLERILRSGVYNRTNAELGTIRELVPKFVHNDSVPRAESLLAKHNALVIEGEPGIGKSTLARILVWLYLADGWNIAVIDDIGEAFDIAHEGKKTLIFFDDFLGQVALSADSVRDMDRRFPPFLKHVRASKHLRFILTTRDYILRQAQGESSRLSAPEVGASELVLAVGDYTRAIRAKILFNHLYFSDLSTREKEALIEDDFFFSIIDHRNFNPRLIELLTSSLFVRLDRRHIREVVTSTLENPEQLWEKPYRAHVGSDGRNLMLSLFFNPPEVSLTQLEMTFSRISRAAEPSMSRLEATRRFKTALKILEGSIISIKSRMVAFSNPGVRDYLQRVITEDNYVDVVVDIVVDFPEVLQLWTFFKAQAPDDQRKQQLRIRWVEAAARLSKAKTGTVLQRLRLMVEMHDFLEANALVEIVETELGKIDQSREDSRDAAEFYHVLRQISVSRLPATLREKATQSVAAAAHHMLATYGESLPLFEIEQLADELTRLTVDEGATKEAIQEALKGFVDNLWLELISIDDLVELEELQEKLSFLLLEYEMATDDADYIIEERRDELETEREELAEGASEDSDDQEEDRDDEDDGSDAAIRSAFQALTGKRK